MKNSKWEVSIHIERQWLLLSTQFLFLSTIPWKRLWKYTKQTDAEQCEKQNYVIFRAGVLTDFWKIEVRCTGGLTTAEEITNVPHELWALPVQLWAKSGREWLHAEQETGWVREWLPTCTAGVSNSIHWFI